MGQLGYERTVVNTHSHPEKWVAWRKLTLPGVPPLQPSPAEGKWAHNFFNAQLRSPLLWLPLCSPANHSRPAPAWCHLQAAWRASRWGWRASYRC